MSGNTSCKLTKTHFVTVIESIREQYEYDKKVCSVISDLLNCEISGSYNNSKYLDSLLSLLRLHFPKDAEGFCEIEHYCFQLNFGKLGEAYESPEELYERLVATRNRSFSKIYAEERLNCQCRKRTQRCGLCKVYEINVNNIPEISGKA